METKNAIDIKHVSITYKCVQSRSIKKSLFSFKKSDVQYVEAIKDVSFGIPRGEIVGIIGKNGSGKSTLLRAIAGIFTPDQGEIDIHGHSVSLLAIGVGFNKKLSGRENIMLTGTLLGFSEKTMREKMDDIIEFAGLERFIDMPVKTYSSGMFSKLAFSITANLETDIMLVDEVLSVGDVKFKKKSYKKMRELIEDKNRTVVIVSHNMDTLRKLCSKMVWLDDGKLIQYGDTDPVLDAYMEFMED